MDEQSRPHLKQMTEPVAHYTEAMTHCMTKVAEEVSHFLNTRREHLTETVTDLSQCRDPTKLMEVQMRWFATTMHDYTEESSRMMSLMQEMVRPMKEATEKSLRVVAGE